MPRLASRKTTAKSAKKPAKTLAPLKSTKKSSKSAKDDSSVIKLVSRARDRKFPTRRTIDILLFR